MRKREYLSPTQLSIFASDPSDYYIKYLSENRPEKEPQTPPMAVGSAFDAVVKSFLTEQLFGKDADPRFEFTALFEAQVEPHNRDKALIAGQYCFDEYKRLGALDSLLLNLSKAPGPPKFEMDVKGSISSKDSTIGGVPFNGKPDCYYTSEEGAHVILDWKINGFYSKSGVSPMKGYIWVREDGKFPKPYGDKVEIYKGLFVNSQAKFEELNLDWCRQLCIYSWLCGEEIGAKFVAQVHQLVCRPGKDKPRIRVAEHSLFISEEFQKRVFDEAQTLWNAINNGHFFTHLTKEESIARCEILDEKSKSMSGDDFFSQMSRGN